MFRQIVMGSKRVRCAANSHLSRAFASVTAPPTNSSATSSDDNVNETSSVAVSSVAASSVITFPSFGEQPKTFGNVKSRHAIPKVAGMVSHGVVDIYVSPEYYGGGKSSYASGFSIDNEGTILTCAHVVIDNMQPVTKSYVKQVRARITFKDGRVFYGTVEKYDLNLDVAIVKLLLEGHDQPFPKVQLGESRTVRLGHWIMSFGFGSPFRLSRSFSIGVVSCTDIKIERTCHMGFAFQSACSANTGSWGGPLIDRDGRVIGIHAWGMSHSVDVKAAGLGYAIQIDHVKKFIHNYYARRNRSRSKSRED